MSFEDFIPVSQVSTYYQVEMSFINRLGEVGLVEIQTIEHSPCIHLDSLTAVEKLIRIHHELEINTESLDVVFHLLEKVESLQGEVVLLKNRLRLYES
jgi:hypothetical protein